MILSLAAILSRRQQLSPVVAGDRDVQNQSGPNWRREPHRRELRRAPDPAPLGQHAALCADFTVQMPSQRRLALVAEPPGALLHHIAGDLRHAFSRRTGTWRE